MTTFFIWVLMVCCFPFAGWLLDEDYKGWLSTLMIAVTGYFVWSVGYVNIFNFLKDNAAVVAIYLAGFIAAGVAVSFFKWFGYVRKLSQNFAEWKENWSFKFNYPDYTKGDEEAKKKYFARTIDNSSSRWHFPEVTMENMDTVRPQANLCKGKITSWIILWPAVGAWMIADNLIINLANHIFDALRGVYQTVADKAFTGK